MVGARESPGLPQGLARRARAKVPPLGVRRSVDKADMALGAIPGPQAIPRDPGGPLDQLSDWAPEGEARQSQGFYPASPDSPRLRPSLLRGQSMTPGPWSPSSVRDYLSCPRKWALKRQGAPERPMPFSPGLIAGTAFHKGMEAYWTGGNVQRAVEDAVSLSWPQEGTEPYSPEKVCSTVLLGAHRGYESLTLEDPGDLVAAEVVLGGPEEEAARH